MPLILIAFLLIALDLAALTVGADSRPSIGDTPARSI
jgi:hypothetical protein